MSSKNNITAVTGEYFVAAELGKRGILALTTPKNNPLYDLVAVNMDGTKSIFIQVKTMSVRNKQGWKLGTDICTRKNNPNLFTILVNLKENDVEYYIYEYDILSSIVETNYTNYISVVKKDGSKKKEVAFRWHDFKFFTARDYERKNNWSILGFG
ncbi:aspartate-ammonia lyase [Sphingobacterium sp. DN00404]|uniref:Aspartate-ammonia lyase n=1 Tax=Sphingobacterium micropteri TaxID=2763501 RepID=A0ABR7YM14_9SPHI|nr:aspartate-ammonia lyase [Sphingobacterium micropteri]MBD1432371.1 aspartate-ammonia lyase [Sphingobacterium micropteri]